MKGVTFEKDTNGKDRFVRFDLEQHGEELRPLLEKMGLTQPEEPLEGWDEALTPEEFLAEAKKIIRQKFEERNKI
ncbi:MAG: hypothetical protein WCY89_02800 [Flavobacteriaceae bacterium]